MEASLKESKWTWMMNYCRNKRLAPANPVFWEEAEKAYEKAIGLPN